MPTWVLVRFRYMKYLVARGCRLSWDNPGSFIQMLLLMTRTLRSSHCRSNGGHPAHISCLAFISSQGAFSAFSLKPYQRHSAYRRYSYGIPPRPGVFIFQAQAGLCVRAGAYMVVKYIQANEFLLPLPSGQLHKDDVLPLKTPLDSMRI